MNKITWFKGKVVTDAGRLLVGETDVENEVGAAIWTGRVTCTVLALNVSDIKDFGVLEAIKGGWAILEYSPTDLTELLQILRKYEGTDITVWFAELKAIKISDYIYRPD
jgi:hypothetical protein